MLISFMRWYYIVQERRSLSHSFDPWKLARVSHLRCRDSKKISFPSGSRGPGQREHGWPRSNFCDCIIPVLITVSSSICFLYSKMYWLILDSHTHCNLPELMMVDLLDLFNYKSLCQKSLCQTIQFFYVTSIILDYFINVCLVDIHSFLYLLWIIYLLWIMLF